MCFLSCQAEPCKSQMKAVSLLVSQRPQQWEIKREHIGSALVIITEVADTDNRDFVGWLPPAELSSG